MLFLFLLILDSRWNIFIYSSYKQMSLALNSCKVKEPTTAELVIMLFFILHKGEAYMWGRIEFYC